METLTTVPSQIIAGDSYNIQLTVANYPVADYTGSLTFVGYTSASVTASAGTGPEDFLFSLTSTLTNITSGTYSYYVQMTSGSERNTVIGGYTNVIGNPALQTTNVSHQEIMLNAIQLVIEGRADDGIQEMTINGRTLKYIPLNELMALRAQYLKELNIMRGGASTARKVIPITFWNR